jgi:excisionase family DNA binding protein
MGTTFLTSLSESELRSCIKEEVCEVLKSLNLNEDKHNPEILSIDEASKLLNLAKPTIYGLTSKRGIPFIKKGKKLYFIKSELLTWLDDGKRSTITEISTEINHLTK